MPKKKIGCQGKEFASIKAFSDAYKLQAGKVTVRLRMGWTPEEAVGLSVRERTGTTGKPVIVTGGQFASIKDAAIANGLKPATLVARIARGYAIEDAVLGKLKPRRGRLKPFEFEGRMFETSHQFFVHYGEKWTNVQRRMNRGWTLREALLLDPAPPRFRDFEGHARDVKWKNVRLVGGEVEPVPDVGGFKLYLVTNTVNGKQYVGITVGSLENRLKQHFAMARRGRKSAFANAIRKYGERCFEITLISDAAATFEQLQQLEVEEIARRDTIRKGYNTAAGGSLGTSKQIAVGGQTFTSYATAADHFGIDAGVFVLRVSRLKWSPEEAAGLQERTWKGKRRPVTLKGVVYGSTRKAAEAHGIDYKLVYGRISNGWTLEQALEFVPAPESARYAGRQITVFGVQYESINHAASVLGVNAESFRKRIELGASPEEAFARARKVAKLPVGE
jgi:hypothetical protein